MAPNNTTKPGSLSQMRKLQASNTKSSNNNNSNNNNPHAKQKRPNYYQIHSNPLPLAVYPLPAFLPQNPLSFLRIAFAFVSLYLFPPSSHQQTWHGYLDVSTRSVHVTDTKSIRALWEMGFFGKGNLSRSEPAWLDQEKKRLGLLASSTSEEITEQRRKEREWMKRERARVEQEILMEQIRKEEIRAGSSIKDISPTTGDGSPNDSQNSAVQSLPLVYAEPPLAKSSTEFDKAQALDHEVLDQEHLQLSFEEAFFLIYALGSLKLVDLALSNAALLTLFRQYSYFPVLDIPRLSPDDPFLVNYAVYHHYRSLGWVIREGLKFAVDYLLYESGPVFKHAAFAVMIVPSYAHDHWQKANEPRTLAQERKGKKDWTWLHCINRVQTQVLKTLILCHVQIPAPDDISDKDIGTILKSYKIREFSISRWSANRNRD